MKERHYVALGLCVSYLILDEIVTLLNTARCLNYLRDSVQELTLERNMSKTSQYLLRIGSAFRNITNLELLRVSHFNFNFHSLPKLSKLTVDGSHCVMPHRASVFDDAVHIKTLTLRNVMAPCVANAFLFAQRFGRLTSLTLDRCLPILVQEVQLVVAQLLRLEELHVLQCFTDRNPLVLKSAPALRVLTLSNCPNLVGVYLHDSPALTSCEITNCPISVKSIESIVACSANLLSLRVERCSLVRQAVSIRHHRLQTLSLHGCDGITDVKVHCPRLQTLHVQLCTALVSCGVRSEYLRSLDLSQLPVLSVLHLDCPQLQKLDVVGCENLGNRDSRRVFDMPTHNLVDSLSRVELNSDSEISDSDSVSTGSDVSLRSLHERRNHHVLAKTAVKVVVVAAESTLVCESDSPGADLVRDLGLHSPLLDLRHFVTHGTRATALHAQKEHLLALVAEFCADADLLLPGTVRTTPVNSPARVKRGAPRSEVKAKKPNRRSGKRRASA